MHPATGCFPRSLDAVGEGWARRLIDQRRTCPALDRVLAPIYELGDELFPDYDGFVSLRVDVMRVAICLADDAIDDAALGDLVESLRTGRITSSEFDTGVQGLLSTSEAVIHHPDDIIEQAMHRKGACGCRVHYHE